MASQESKALRGTKRVCQACEVRFYDLAREPIVCPSCGAGYKPVVQPAAAANGSTGWRNRNAKHAIAPLPEPKPKIAPADDLPEDEEASEEGASPVLEDDIVLEQEPDDGDVTGLVDREADDQRDR